MVKNLDGSISKRNLFIALIICTVAIATIFQFTPKPLPRSLAKLSPSFNLDISELNDEMVAELNGLQTSCSQTKCRLFVRVKSNIKAICDLMALSCHYSENSNSYVQNLKQLEKLVPNWETYLIYDFDINNFNYKITEFKLPPKNKNELALKSQPFLFSDKGFTDLIKKDFNSYAGSFGFLIVGSNLDLLFASILSEVTSLKSEIAAFWKMVFEIKGIYPNSKISTSLSYEHMRGTNFWTQMDRDNIKKLDFFSMSSTPLSLRWSEYSSFFIQLYLYTEDKVDLLDNYYDDLQEFVTAQQPIVLTEFRFPIEPNDPYRLGAFLELSNFTTFFKYASFCIQRNPTQSSYLNKTTFYSIKKYKEIRDTL